MLLTQVKETNEDSHLIVPIEQTMSVKGFLIDITVTEKVGGACDVKNKFGRIRYSKQGRTFVDMGLDYLYWFNSIAYGMPHWSAVNEGEHRLVVYLPRRFMDDSVEVITKADRATIYLDNSFVIGTDVTSGNVNYKIYADLEMGVQKYNLTMFEQNESYGAAGHYTMDLELDNILYSLVSSRDSATQELELGTTIDRLKTGVENLYGDIDINSLVDHTYIQNRVEDAASWSSDIAVNNYAAMGDITAKMADRMQLGFDLSGAYYPAVLLIGATFDPERLEKTITAQNKRFIAQTNKKSAEGKGAQVAAIKRVAQQS